MIGVFEVVGVMFVEEVATGVVDEINVVDVIDNTDAVVIGSWISE